MLMKIFHQQRARFPRDLGHRGNEITLIVRRNHAEENNS